VSHRAWPAALATSRSDLGLARAERKLFGARAIAFAPRFPHTGNRQDLPKVVRKWGLCSPLGRLAGRKRPLSAFFAAILTKKNNSDTQPPHAAGFRGPQLQPPL
jgi:hypothetical protein